MDKTKVVIPKRFENHPIFNEQIYGMNFGFLAKRGYYLRPEVKKQPELMSKMGVNWVTVNMSFCQDTYFSRKTYLDFEYSTGELELAEITKNLHDHGIKVLFKPCLTPLDGAWMGLVDFPDNLLQIEGKGVSYWDEWFSSYIHGARYFAELAERIGMDAMMIGAEYYGTERKDDLWYKVIEETRKLYSGPITYEITPPSKKASELKWMNELDFISYSYYPPGCVREEPFDPVNNPSFSLDEIKNHLSSRKKRISELSARFGNKPVAFTEFGIRSAHGCLLVPHNFDWKTRYDGEEQANYMQAGVETFLGMPEWMGFFWWKWDETQNRPHYHDEKGVDKGFTIQGKPAEAVFKKLVGKA